MTSDSRSFHATTPKGRRGLLALAGAALVGTALGSVTLPATAQEDWRLTSAAQPGLLRDHHVRVADAIAKGSNGALKTEFQFVASEQEALQQVVRGRLQVGVISVLGLASIAPEMAVFATPYLWTSPAEGDAVLDKQAMPWVAPIMEAKGLVLIGMTETGFNDVVGRTPLLTPADVKGRKMRVSPAASSQFFWSQLGANGVQLPLGELFPGLEQGLVEGADLPFVYYITTPAAKSAPNVTLTRHTHLFNGVVVNKAAWDKLTPQQQEGVRRAVPSYATLRAEVRAAEGPLMSKFESDGGKVHPLTDAQRKAWYDMVAPGQPAYVEKIGPAAVALFKQIQAAKSAR
jgi:TRAP-type C4-dicarboxylate transport system substrate-binding protein